MADQTTVDASSQNNNIQSSVDPLLAARNLPMSGPEFEQRLAEYKAKSTINRFFPILPEEHVAFLWLLAMLMMTALTYSFLRVFKDRVVNSVLDSSDSKNYLKLFTFVATQIFVINAQNLSSKYGFNTAYTKLTKLFIGLLVGNGVMMMLSRYIQPRDLFTDSLFAADQLTVRGFKYLYPLFLILNQYTYSIFYIFGEVIGSIMVSFCFMTYVNNNTNASQNKRFIKSLLFFSNLASTAAGLGSLAWNEYYKDKPRENLDMYFLIFPVGVALFYVCILYCKKKLEVEFALRRFNATAAPKKAGAKKAKIGFKDSFYLMFNSKLLMSMSALSLIYNTASNLFDNTNTSGMNATAKLLNENVSNYATKFKSFDAISSGLLTAAIVLTPLSLYIDTAGIFYFAMAPIAIIVLATFIMLFFSYVNLPLLPGKALWPFSPLTSSAYNFAVPESYFSTAIQIAIKVSKYAFYDIVKEAISMKIEPDLRPLFKGVFDGSMAKFGKCAGSLYGIIMSSIFPQGDARVYFLITATGLLLGFIFWTSSAKYLHASFMESNSANTYMNPDMEEKTKF